MTRGGLDSIARRRVPRAVVDVVMALLMVVGGLGMPVQAPEGPVLRDPDVWRVLLVLLSGVPLAVHRKWPLPVVLVVALAVGLLQAFRYIPPPVGEHGTTIGVSFVMLAVAVFVTAVRSTGRTATLMLAVLVPAFVVGEILMVPDYRTAAAVTMTGLLVVAWAFGRLFQGRKAMATEALERAAAVEREQAANARAAVAQERAHIARELHDIVAHNVSLMVVQTIAADRVQDRDGAKAHELHRSIEETGRAAVTELRRLLVVLRTDDEEDDDPSRQPPQPTMDQIPALVDSVRAAGLEIDFVTSGEPAELSAGFELAVYRVIQEAFTNTLKHAGRTSAQLSLTWRRDGHLVLHVCDAGRRPGHEETPPGQALKGAGHGLVGMRERVAAVGGTLHTGERPSGGYCVHATIPLPGHETTGPDATPPGDPGGITCPDPALPHSRGTSEGDTPP
ncbi:sensor histidine kinase [Streptomyces sp. NPDC056470]|uniref:sensor histidine kinase n=1 Tax=Streptomyces sp. NPDC056470 TaxID=3345831 RepID=UPI0036C1F2EA